MTEHHPVTVAITQVEYRTDSRFVPVPAPRLTWVTETDIPDWCQAWAEVESGGSVARIDGRDSVLVDWPFDRLDQGDARTVRVRVHGEDGSVSGWSEWREVEAGFLADGAWSARLVGLTAPDRTSQPALLRGEFDVTGPVRRATLYATAQGIYQVEINGSAVDEETLKPGWTSYQWRYVHETTDVTALLHTGRNAMGIQLAGGWYSESYGFGEDKKPFYGDQPAAAAQLVITYQNGDTAVVATGESWTASGDGPVVSASIYDGQHDDAQRSRPGWSTPGFDDSSWDPVRVHAVPTPAPRLAPPVRVVAELPVVEHWVAPSGVTVLDFGQNIAGRLRLRLDVPAGTTIVARHAEILDGEELDTHSLRGAAATDSFVSDGSPRTWEPQFTVHGFRYASIDGWSGGVPEGAVTAVAISSDLERTGWLETSHPLVDRLHESVVWSMRGNFVSLPTDCPQRDERLGWTGDIQVFAPTAATLFDVDGFLVNWLADLALEQKSLDGVVPYVVPNISSVPTFATAAWGDAATVVPWVLHHHYGDTRVLEDQYESMTTWVDLVDRLAGSGHLWKGGFQFGDWLDPTTPPEFPLDARADAELVATAYFAYSAQLLAANSAALGKADDAARYRDLAAAIKAAFHEEYVTGNGRVVSDAQTAYALAIVFGLAADDEEIRRLGANLGALVRRNGYHIGTGFAGTSFLAEALSRSGQLTVLDRLLTQTEQPSWLYPLTQGATTTWEAWDAIRPDGSPHPNHVSFNHYAFGAVAHWLHERLAGLGAAEPGYRTLRIAPTPLPSFDHARSRRRTPYGIALSGWRREGDLVRVSATVPPNTTAVVQLPDGSAEFTVGAGSHEWTARVPVPARRRPGLSLTTDGVDVIDDPAAYAAVLAAFDRHAPWAADALRSHPRWHPGVPLIMDVFMLPAHVREAIDAELAAFGQGS